MNAKICMLVGLARFNGVFCILGDRSLTTLSLCIGHFGVLQDEDEMRSKHRVLRNHSLGANNLNLVLHGPAPGDRNPSLTRAKAVFSGERSLAAVEDILPPTMAAPCLLLLLLLHSGGLRAVPDKLQDFIL